MRGSGLFDDDRLIFFVFNIGRTRDDAGVRIVALEVLEQRHAVAAVAGHQVP